ncbi:hypothetical protein LCGC14_0385060 [marine sediment metagenome]|uniref:Uncharacterized protein n=1 Tax=marine sediment metagenome TaxID=412755 RepID=A0A0F9T720_9ZZZZ
MILLTDEEIRGAIQDYNATLNQCCDDSYFTIHADSFNAIAKAQLKKVVEWGNEWCPVHTIEISKDVTEVIAKHQCCECWQALLKEVE